MKLCHGFSGLGAYFSDSRLLVFKFHCVSILSYVRSRGNGKGQDELLTSTRGMQSPADNAHHPPPRVGYRSTWENNNCQSPLVATKPTSCFAVEGAQKSSFQETQYISRWKSVLRSNSQVWLECRTKYHKFLREIIPGLPHMKCHSANFPFLRQK